MPSKRRYSALGRLWLVSMAVENNIARAIPLVKLSRRAVIEGEWWRETAAIGQCRQQSRRSRTHVVTLAVDEDPAPAKEHLCPEIKRNAETHRAAREHRSRQRTRRPRE